MYRKPCSSHSRCLPNFGDVLSKLTRPRLVMNKPLVLSPSIAENKTDNCLFSHERVIFAILPQVATVESAGQAARKIAPIKRISDETLNLLREAQIGALRSERELEGHVNRLGL